MAGGSKFPSERLALAPARLTWGCLVGARTPVENAQVQKKRGENLVVYASEPPHPEGLRSGMGATLGGPLWAVESPSLWKQETSPPQWLAAWRCFD